MKETIKAWLRASEHDREWLGQQLGVNKRTIDNWLSSQKEIPPQKLRLIQRLMDDDAAEEARRRQHLQPTAQVFSLEVDLPTFRAYSQAALAKEQTLEDWSISELNAAATAYFTSQPPTQIPAPPKVLDYADTAKDLPQRVAEDPPRNITHLPEPPDGVSAALAQMEALDAAAKQPKAANSKGSA